MQTLLQAHRVAANATVDIDGLDVDDVDTETVISTAWKRKDGELPTFHISATDNGVTVVLRAKVAGSFVNKGAPLVVAPGTSEMINADFGADAYSLGIQGPSAGDDAIVTVEATIWRA